MQVAEAQETEEGERVGLRASLKAKPHKPAIPSFSQELVLVAIIAVNVPPLANAKLAMKTALHQPPVNDPSRLFYNCGKGLQSRKPEVPRFNKNVISLTRENNTLDQVYTNNPDAFKASPCLNWDV